MAGGGATRLGGGHTGEGVPASPRAGTWAGRGGTFLHLGGTAGARHLLGFLAAPAPNTRPGTAAAARTGTPGPPLHPCRLCGGDAGQGSGTPLHPSPQPGVVPHHGDTRGVPNRGGSIQSPVPGQPRLTPAHPCQTIFTNTASVIAIKLMMRRRRLLRPRAAVSTRGAAAARQRPLGDPSCRWQRGPGEEPEVTGTRQRAVAGGGKWVPAGMPGIPTWAGAGAARPALHGFALALELLERGHQPGVDASAGAGLGAAAAAGAARAGAPGGPVRPVDVLWGWEGKGINWEPSARTQLCKGRVAPRDDAPEG